MPANNPLLLGFFRRWLIAKCLVISHRSSAAHLAPARPAGTRAPLLITAVAGEIWFLFFLSSPREGFRRRNKQENSLNSSRLPPSNMADNTAAFNPLWWRGRRLWPRGCLGPTIGFPGAQYPIDRRIPPSVRILRLIHLGADNPVICPPLRATRPHGITLSYSPGITASNLIYE